MRIELLNTTLLSVFRFKKNRFIKGKKNSFIKGKKNRFIKGKKNSFFDNLSKRTVFCL